MFFNFINHKSAYRFDAQITTASKLRGNKFDIQIRKVSLCAIKEKTEKMVTEIMARIESLCPSAAMCQGKFALAFSVSNKIKK